MRYHKSSPTYIFQLRRIDRLTISPSTTPLMAVPIVDVNGDPKTVTSGEGNQVLEKTLGRVKAAFNDINSKIAQLNDKTNAICNQC